MPFQSHPAALLCSSAGGCATLRISASTLLLLRFSVSPLRSLSAVPVSSCSFFWSDPVSSCSAFLLLCFSAGLPRWDSGLVLLRFPLLASLFSDFLSALLRDSGLLLLSELRRLDRHATEASARDRAIPSRPGLFCPAPMDIAPKSADNLLCIFFFCFLLLICLEVL